MIFWNFECGKNEQFSITDYSKTIRRRKKVPDNKSLLIVWTFHKNMNKRLFLIFEIFKHCSFFPMSKFQKIISSEKKIFRNKQIPVDYFALESDRKNFHRY